MLASKFEKPKNIGDSKRILVNDTSSEKSGEEAKTGKSHFITIGATKKATIPPRTITKKKKVNIESIKLLASPSPFSNLSIRNGMRTEIETIEAMVTNNKSGILNAE